MVAVISFLFATAIPSIYRFDRFFQQTDELGRFEVAYTCTSSDANIAKVTVVNGTLMEVTGIATGTARITVKPSVGMEQTIVVMRRGRLLTLVQTNR
mgnify:CR=1 FL=1